MKQSEWVRIVALWASLWPHRPLPPESIAAWYQLVADLDGAAVKAGLLAWAADPDRSWPPSSPGELRGVVLEPAADWSEAITELATAVRRNGRYAARPELGPLLDGYVDSVGGWTRLCDRFDPSDPAIRAQFRDYWTAACRRERRDTAAALGRAAMAALPEGSGP
jgi:hypothetical protein